MSYEQYDDAEAIKKNNGPMDDKQLCVLIDHERSNGIGLNDQLASDRAKAMAFYVGEAKGILAPPDVDGRSKVVSKELMEVVEWAMPVFMRMYCGTDDIVKFEPEAMGDEKACNDATEYCSYLLHRKNPGFVVLHDAIKSALISRIGVVKVYCDERWDEREEHYENLSQIDVQALSADEFVDLVSVEEVQQTDVSMVNGQAGDAQQQPVVYNATVKRKEQKRQFKVEGVPPEEVWFSKDSRYIDGLRCIGHDVRRTISDLLSLGYDADKVYTLPKGTLGDTYGEKYERERYDGSWSIDEDDSLDISQRIVMLNECYIRADYDGDGIAEYRRVVKCGTVVFENEVVEDHPFAIFSPVLMPYKLIGLSMWDLVEDLQRIKTAITRQYLDNLYLANTPRTAVVEGQVNLDDLLNPRPGGLVRTKDLNALDVIQTPDIGAQALSGIQFFDGVRDARTGIKEFSQGLVGNELSKSKIGSEGLQQLMDQGAQRVELMARVFAETGVKRIFQLLLKLVTQYQDRQEQVRISGKWMTIDPRAWKNNYDMTVSVGVGTSSKDRQLAMSMQLLQVQAQAAQYGLVQPQQAYNALEDMASAMGKKDASRYFMPPDQAQQQPPQPSESDKQMQLEQYKAQSQAQLQSQKHQNDAQLEVLRQQAQAAQQQHEKQLEAERNQLKMEQDERLATIKAQLDADLARYKAELQAQTQIEVARINAEARIAAAKSMGAKDASTADETVDYEERNEQA